MNHVVFGAAACLLDDKEALAALMPGGFTGRTWVVGEAGLHILLPVDHWVHLHADQFPAWIAERKRLGGNTDMVKWTRDESPWAGYADRTAPHWRGSSGLLAISAIAVVDPDPRITLCGVPMDDQPHIGGVVEWGACTSFWPDWVARMAWLRRHVRSMSGWTLERLGKPTAEWLGEEKAA